jgi:hypothetical protein
MCCWGKQSQEPEQGNVHQVTRKTKQKVIHQTEMLPLSLYNWIE